MAEGKQFNMKNPAVKRILQEVKEMQRDPCQDYMSMPLEEDIFEWQFAVHGPKDSEFEGGIYHGRIILPPEYPFKPPSFMMLTPSGRFEVHTKICLSISNYHPEHWQPSWSVRTALVALIAFMPSKPDGAVGSLDLPTEARKALAAKSRAAPPKFGSVERQKVINQIHDAMLQNAPPVREHMEHSPAAAADREPNADLMPQDRGEGSDRAGIGAVPDGACVTPGCGDGKAGGGSRQVEAGRQGDRSVDDTLCEADATVEDIDARKCAASSPASSRCARAAAVPGVPAAGAGCGIGPGQRPALPATSSLNIPTSSAGGGSTCCCHCVASSSSSPFSCPTCTADSTASAPPTLPRSESSEAICASQANGEPMAALLNKRGRTSSKDALIATPIQMDSDATRRRGALLSEEAFLNVIIFAVVMAILSLLVKKLLRVVGSE